MLFNYVSDASGAHDYTANLDLSGLAAVPGTVHVRYLLAVRDQLCSCYPSFCSLAFSDQPSVSTQDANITWAGQTLGTAYTSTGELSGTVQNTSLPCTDGICSIPLKAPSVAVVFFTDDALANSSPQDSSPSSISQVNLPPVVSAGVTYTPTPTAISPLSLETSNGHGGKDQ